MSIGVTGYREVTGTIRDKWDRTNALELELVEDGTRVAAARTQAATGESTGAFVFVLHEALLDNKIHEFDLRVKDFGGVLGTWSFYLAPPRSESDLLAAAADPMWSDLPAVVDAVSRHKSRASTPTRTELARADLADAEMDATLADVEEREVKARLVKCRLELAEALRAERNWAAAIDQFRQAQETDPESIEAVRGYVLALLDTGQETAAEQAVEKALLRFPDAGELYALSDDVQGRRRAHAVRTIAFYLPQFHPVPENDQWWGRGFTEWHNVGSGFPMFDGHLQPRRPTTLGYYDLRLQDAVNAQFDLARRYGIDGFCYYYYWFEGRRVLNRPLDELASGRTGPFPFCICWANEDWTRSWDGSTGEVLLAQNHSPEGDFAFIEDIAPLLKNPNYIRVEGRPMVLVYRADKLATPKATIARWREWCRDQGIGELHLCAVQSFRFHDPRPLGFDAAVEFPPHCPWDRYPDPPYLKVLDDLPNRVPGFDGVVYDYQAFAKAAMARPREPFTLHRTAMVAWDNTARRGKRAAVYHGFTTQTFRKWMLANAHRAAIEQSDAVCFVNAWNEWAEGSVMEPDVHFGHEILELTRDVSRQVRYDPCKTFWRTGRPLFPEDRLENRQRVLLIGHDAFPSGAQTNMLNMARCLKRQLQVDVTLMLIEGGELLPEFEKVATTYVIGKASDWRSGLQAELKTHAVLGARKAICNTVLTGDVCDVLKEEGYKVVGLLHEMPALIESYGLQAQCWRFADKTDAIVAASKVVADEFSHRYWPDPKKVLIAPQGIAFNRYEGKRSQLRAEVRKELSLPSESLIVMGCGYGDTRKGIDLFVRVAGAVKQRCEPGRVAFVWVGALDEPIAPYVMADAKRLGADDAFRVTGRTSDAARYFAASDVFALTSREDPFPSVVMEAFDARLPVVAFDGGGGYVDIVGPETGALVPYLDTSAMTAEVLRFLQDDARRAQVGENNHRLCRERFGYEPYLRKILALLADVPADQVAAGHLQRQTWFGEKPRPRITAIVPNYNYARYLELRLNTVLQQTLPPDEVIVLDDASQDHSLEVVRAIAEQSRIPIKVITSTRNSGNPFVQWAKGLEAATGDLIWIAEADDYCEPTLLETLAHELHDEKVVMAWCDSIMVDDAGRSNGEQYKDYYSKRNRIEWSIGFRIAGRELIDSCLFVENVVPNASAVLFRHSAIDFSLAPIMEFKFSGDWWFWVLLARNGDVAYVADTLNYHRRHVQSVMGAVLTATDDLVRESIALYQRLALAVSDLLSDKMKRAALDRLEELYRQFGAQEGPLGLGTHPRLGLPYQRLSHALLGRPAPSSAGNTSALLVMSEDAVNSGEGECHLLAKFLQSLGLRRVIFLKKVNSAVVLQGSLLPSGSQLETLEIETSNIEALDQAITQPDLRIFSYGLLSHCALLESRARTRSDAQFSVISGPDFDALLGRPPSDGVSVESLSQLIRTCDQIIFLGQRPSHPLARIAQMHKRVMHRHQFDYSASAEQRAHRELRFIGFAESAPLETWGYVSQALSELAGRGRPPMKLCLIGWSEAGDQLLRWRPDATNVESLLLHQPLRNLASLGDAVIRWTDEVCDTNECWRSVPFVVSISPMSTPSQIRARLEAVAKKLERTLTCTVEETVSSAN